MDSSVLLTPTWKLAARVRVVPVPSALPTDRITTFFMIF